MEHRAHKSGQFETVKFEKRRDPYYESLEKILGLGYSSHDHLHYFPSFVGHVTLLRTLTLCELYKRVLGLAGHIAEVGVYKGAGSILFAKLIQIFEPESLTMVHGFDWFQGTDASKDKLQVHGANLEDEARLRKLIALQNLDHILKVHRMDVTKELDGFFAEHEYMRFKLVFLDSGTYEVTAASIKAFWPHITPGGILVLDQYNHEVAPGEVKAVADLLPGLKVQTIPNSWMPNAFIVKP